MVVAALAGLLGVPLTAEPALANPTIVVTTTEDVVDPDDGVVSLREAVTKANNDAGADVIQLAAGATYELTICGDPEDLMTADNGRRDLNALDPAGLEIKGTASTVRQQCTGAGAGLLRSGSHLVFPVPFTVEGVEFDGGFGVGSLIVSGALRLRDTMVTNFVGPPGRSSPYLAAVYATDGVDAERVDVSDNDNVAGISSGGDLKVTDSLVARNGGPGLEAGGLWSDGNLTVTRSTVADNTAADTSLPVDEWGPTGGVKSFGTLSVIDSVVSGNTGFVGGVGTSGGGGSVVVLRSLIEENHGVVAGGLSGRLLSVEHTTIRGNDAALGAGAGGAGTIADSTIVDNHAIVLPSMGVGGAGGGIAARGQMRLFRSTVTGNTAAVGSALLVESWNAGTSWRIEDSTITDNPIDESNTTWAEPGSEIADLTQVPGTLLIYRSVIGTVGVRTCALDQTIVSSGGSPGRNFWTGSTCSGTSDIVNGGDPGLGPLQDNGGPTLTRSPVAGSPLRDRIPLSDPGCAETDQRGEPRRQGLGCDIGSVEVAVPPAGFVGVSPVRILDTREPPGNKLAAPGSVDVKLAGANGVPAEATAVVVNVTSTEASSADAFVTVWGSGLERPSTSTLNLQPGANVANSATIAPGVGGKISLYTNTGATHLIVDVLGYYVPSGDRFAGVNPMRVLDTRTGPVPARRPLGQKLSGPGSIRVPLADQYGIPADVSAVVFNITSAEATSANGFVTAWPSGQPRPDASNLNLQPQFNVSNLAFVKLGTNGAIDLYTNTGATHLIVDVVGWFRPSTGDRFLPVNPARLFDSRSGSAFGPGDTQFAPVAGSSGIPADASSVVLNATSTQASSAGGFLTVRAKGTPLPNPLTSNLNYRPPYNAPNQVLSRVGDDESVALYNGWATTHIVLDATGYFVGP